MALPNDKVHITNNVRARLLRARLQRVLSRPRKPCKTCGDIPTVCPDCARVWCLNCHPTECPRFHTKPTALSLRPTNEGAAEAVVSSGSRRSKRGGGRRKTDLRPRTKPIKRKAPEIDVPGFFKHFVAQIQHRGWDVQSLTRTDSHQDRWYAVVATYMDELPAGAVPEVGQLWYGHHLHGWSSGPGGRLGKVISATLNQKSEI